MLKNSPPNKAPFDAITGFFVPSKASKLVSDVFAAGSNTSSSSTKSTFLNGNPAVLDATNLARNAYQLDLGEVARGTKASGPDLDTYLGKARAANAVLVLYYDSLHQIIEALSHRKTPLRQLTFLAPEKGAAKYIENFVPCDFFSVDNIPSIVPSGMVHFSNFLLYSHCF